MSGKPQPPRTHCKRGHELIESNLEKSMLRFGIRRCKTCNRAYIRDYKRRKRRERGIVPRKERTLKTHCIHGHALTPANLRGGTHAGKRECLTCHRDREMKKKREQGVKPMVPRTRERTLAIKRKAEAKRRALRQGAFVENVDPLRVFERDEGVCGICSEPIKDRYEIDHIVPLSRGGEHSYANVQLAHPRCNRRKHAKLPEGVAA